jgi:hypothetical protein
MVGGHASDQSAKSAGRDTGDDAAEPFAAASSAESFPANLANFGEV